MSEVEFPGLTRAVNLIIGAHVQVQPTAVSPISGDQLYEVVVDGPTGDCSWGFYVDEEIAMAEAKQLNSMFQTVAAFIPDEDATIKRDDRIEPRTMLVYPVD